jgi:glucan biosynthesis protein
MAVIQKNDRVFVPFKLVQVGSETFLVPDSSTKSYIASGHNKHKKIDWHTNHLSQIYISNSRMPEELITSALAQDFEKFSKHANELGHNDTKVFFDVINERLDAMNVKKQKQINFDNDETFFDDVF